MYVNLCIYIYDDTIKAVTGTGGGLGPFGSPGNFFKRSTVISIINVDPGLVDILGQKNLDLMASVVIMMMTMTTTPYQIPTDNQ